MVNSEFDIKISKLDYTFAPLNRERGFLGIVAGLYVARFKLALREQAVGTAESEDLTAPLPVVGLRGAYDITSRLTLRGAAEIFKLDTANVDGKLTDVYIGVDYSFAGRWAVGLAYNDVGVDFDAQETGGYVGAVDWKYDGYLLYFKVDLGE